MPSLMIYGRDVAKVRQHQGRTEDGPYASLYLPDGSTTFLLTRDRSKEWRELADSIIAGCDYVERAERLGVVPIASLAPDTNPAA